jgi:hypothetical protein
MGETSALAARVAGSRRALFSKLRRFMRFYGCRIKIDSIQRKSGISRQGGKAFGHAMASHRHDTRVLLTRGSAENAPIDLEISPNT